MNQTEKHYGKMKNKKVDDDDIDAMLEGVAELPPQYDQIKVWKTTARDMVTDRLQIVTIDRLMKAAKAKQRHLTTRTLEENHEDYDIYIFRTTFDILDLELPDLSAGDNQNMLREAATIVFNSSQKADPIETMADKVVILCTYIYNCNQRNDYAIYLNDDQIMSIINSVLQTHTFYDAFNPVFKRLNCMNLQVANRPYPNKPQQHRLSTNRMLEVDGGYYKKNNKRSIKKKSRKLRSRR